MPRLKTETVMDFLNDVGVECLTDTYRVTGFYCECADGKPYKTGIDRSSDEYKRYLDGVEDPRD